MKEASSDETSTWSFVEIRTINKTIQPAATLNGLLVWPWQIQLSGIFRAQSGFHYSRTGSSADPDGNGTLNGIDLGPGRNAFTAPP